MLVAVSLVGVALTGWWVVKRAPHRVGVANPPQDEISARSGASDIEPRAGRCGACRAAIVEEDSLFCPRCGARLKSP
jgi:uncharacterized paraquat-inducible protein A